MKTIVVKGDSLSSSDKKQLTHTSRLDIKLVIVEPLGDTSTIITSQGLFMDIVEEESIIYS